jgi:hypothetical protein
MDGYGLTYEELLEEAKHATAKEKEFSQRYPRWNRYLTAKAVLFKTLIDYRMIHAVEETNSYS